MGISMSFSAQAFTPQGLWQAWPELRFVKTPAACLRHAELLQNLQMLAERYPERIRLQEIGLSWSGRSIQMLSVGTGEAKILLWSQMHGDEPSATPALLDIADYLLAHADDPAVRAILDNFTLLMIPMLNPDGAEVYQRYNAQGIDINRDALRLATPEGRILKRIRDEYEPMLGFNLHDQDRRTAVGDTGQVATSAVLAVSGDAANTLTDGRRRSRRACAAIVEALAPFYPGGMARYDEEWSPRAFGDNITAWGTPVVLIESGGVPPGREFSDLSRLNFVAILTVLKGLAEDDLAGYDPQVYEALQVNQSDVFSDIIIRGGQVLQPGSNRPFPADIAFDVLHNDQQLAGCAGPVRTESKINLLGDASFHGAGTFIDAGGSVLLPAFDAGVKGWGQRKWLDHDNLTRLAQWGVGTLVWQVGEKYHQAAVRHAAALDGPGLPHLSVVSKTRHFPQVVLDGPPPQADFSSLASIMRALGIDGPMDAASIARLWIQSGAGDTAAARLRKHRPASFVLVSATPDGELKPEQGSIQSVWLEGQQIKRDATP